LTSALAAEQVKMELGTPAASEADIQESPTAAEVHQLQLESAVHLDSDVEASQEEAVKPCSLL